VDVTAILEDLRSQRDRVLECILALERLEARKPRRGRPPSWIAAARGDSPDPAMTHIDKGSPAKRKRGRARKRR
jgi:hypothetical protein